MKLRDALQKKMTIQLQRMKKNQIRHCAGAYL